ncbi:MAG: hypothetical protein ABI142_11175, partial [Bryocella sp.]
SNPTAPHIHLGISPVLGVHDAEVCHIARGEDPTWHGQLTATTPNGLVELTAATYNNGTTQRLEASSVCDASGCHQFSQTSRHITLVYSYPSSNLPLEADTDRQVPILLTAETPNPTVPPAVARPPLAAAINDFLAGADLVNLTAPYGRRTTSGTSQ